MEATARSDSACPDGADITLTAGIYIYIYIYIYQSPEDL